MKEESWYKMFFVALLLHVILLAAFSIPLRKAVRKIDLSSYSVNLVADVEGPSKGSSGATAPAPPAAKKATPAPAPRKKVERKEPARAKPILQPKEQERSITASKAKPVERQEPVPQKKTARELETASRGDVESLDEKIQEMRKRTQYMDVGGGGKESTAKGGGDGGLPTAGAGGGRPLDPALKAYYLEVLERIEKAWRSPGLVKKSLETVISIRIRKDGRIMDWQIEQRSGDRVFDETVARTLRSIDMLPPIPPSLNLTEIDVGFNFHP
jgi:colicin import membrane protein